MDEELTPEQALELLTDWASKAEEWHADTAGFQRDLRQAEAVLRTALGLPLSPNADPSPAPPPWVWGGG